MRYYIILYYINSNSNSKCVYSINISSTVQHISAYDTAYRYMAYHCVLCRGPSTYVLQHTLRYRCMYRAPTVDYSHTTLYCNM
jgi:hypothetical protein